MAAVIEAADRPGPEAAVRQAQADIQEAIRLAGLRGDPLGTALEALSAVLEAQLTVQGAIGRTLAGPRSPLRDEDMAELVRVARLASQADLLARERQRGRRFGTIWAALAAVCVLTTATAAYEAGAAPRRQAEQRLAAAFQDGGPAAAAVWAELMENNDVLAARQQCTGPRSFADATGRKVCLLPVYLEPPRRAPASTPHG